MTISSRKPSRCGLRRNPPQVQAAPVQRQTGKSSDAGAAILSNIRSILPSPLPDVPDNLRAWFKEFEQWLLILRTHFYDFTEGMLGPEGDPIRLSIPKIIREESPELTPAELWELFDGDYALAAGSKMSMAPAPAIGSRADVRGAWVIARQLELSLL